MENWRLWIAEKYRHNKELVFAAAFLLCSVFLYYGCESKGQSLIEPGKKVTRETLESEKDIETKRIQRELDDLQHNYQLSNEEIDKWDAVKRLLVEETTITKTDPETGQTTTIVNSNPDPMKILFGIGSLFGLPGLGLAFRRGSVLNSKDQEIRELRFEGVNETPKRPTVKSPIE